MGKVKSVIITVLLALAIAVAAFFAVVSFPATNKVKGLTSIASNIHLGADLSGYAYTTVYPEGVITAEEYVNLQSDKQSGYIVTGGLYVEEQFLTDSGFVNGESGEADINAFKKAVADDADSLNKRFGQKGYSSYSVAVEDGVSIKISVPTNFTYNAYKYPGMTVDDGEKSRSTDLSVAQAALSSLTAYGDLTLRTTDTSISLTDSDNNATTYDCTKRGKDKWVEIAQVDGNDTYSLANGDRESEYFKSIKSSTVGNVSRITFNFTAEGRAKFKELTTRAASSTSKVIYFCVGDRVLVNFECNAAIDEKSLVLSANDKYTAENAAITMDSAIGEGALSLIYKDYSNTYITEAAGGKNAALMTFIASVLVLAGLCVLLTVKYKKLGAVVSLLSIAFALVILYALFLLNIQVTFAVVLTAAVLLGLFVISNAIAFAETKRMTESGRTMQASVKEAYKKVLMTVSDIHIVLVIVAILLAAVGVGEVAACGLISVIGVAASYVLYWLTRFMWYVTSSPVKDKFGFAGLKRVVYEDD